MIQNTAIYKKLNEKMKQRKSKLNDSQPPPSDTDIHQFYELLNVIDRPVNTGDYGSLTPKEPQPKPVEPTQSVIELPKHPDNQAPTPPSKEIEEEPEMELEPWQQQSKQRDITSDLHDYDKVIFIAPQN